ncbi:hypothetical protein AB0K00_31115 [Dactylosporangium sp. NPDC049525]|uniref:hypothetical protein n=1 Tax=Dactylosporangium sp. NPDC049525 TaxID=3154730 RepID=UPI0034296270
MLHRRRAPTGRSAGCTVNAMSGTADVREAARDGGVALVAGRLRAATASRRQPRRGRCHDRTRTPSVRMASISARSPVSALSGRVAMMLGDAGVDDPRDCRHADRPRQGRRRAAIGKPRSVETVTGRMRRRR